MCSLLGCSFLFPADLGVTVPVIIPVYGKMNKIAIIQASLYSTLHSNCVLTDLISTVVKDRFTLSIRICSGRIKLVKKIYHSIFKRGDEGNYNNSRPRNLFSFAYKQENAHKKGQIYLSTSLT